MQPNITYSTSARAAIAIQQSFSWMFGGLLFTAISAYAAASDADLQRALQTNPILFLGLLFAEIGLVIYLSAGIQRMSHTTAIVSFLSYAVLNGVTFSLLLLHYTGASIAGAFLSTSLIFGVMALYGYATKTDLSSIGNLAIMVIVGLIIASVVNIFLHSTPLMFAISGVTVIIFAGLTAYDTQKIKALSGTIQGGNLGIYGALSLYLDFINIFIALLRIFGGNRRD